MLKSAAWGVSAIFHPLLMPTYMLVLLLLINPYLFGVSHIGDRQSIYYLLLVFMYTFLMPFISVLVMYFLGMVSALEMPKREDRIGPYLITGMLYVWVYYNFAQTGELPPPFVSFMLGAVIALFMGFFINIFSKISMHAVGMGGLVGMVLITFLFFSYGYFAVDINAIGSFEISMISLLLITVLMAGLVGTARLLLKAHQPIDIYGGYLIGFFAQLVALKFCF